MEMRVSAEAASRAVAAKQNALSASRVPQVLPLIKKLAMENRVYAFNVGPWPCTRTLGSLGMKTVPACPEGKQFSKPLVFDGIITEPYPVDPPEYKLLEYEGQQVAEQFLGEGAHLSKRDSFRQFGVFLCNSETPTEKQLATANAELIETYRSLVEEMNIEFSKTGLDAIKNVRNERHMLAAQKLKKTELECPWMRDSQTPVERKECDNCGTPYRVGIAQCPQCRFILDQAKFEKNKARFAN